MNRSLSILAAMMALAWFPVRAGAQSFAYDHAGRVTRAGYDTGASVAYHYMLDGSLTNVASAVGQAEEDTDGDGMPDAWEWVFFNTLTNAAAGDFNDDTKDNLQHYLDQTDPADPDSDGDGALNWDELAAGTDPLDSNSVFQVSGFRSQVSGPVVEWSSVVSKRYRIQRSAHLPGGFGNLLTNVLATPPLNVHTDETAVGVGPWIYRVELE